MTELPPSTALGSTTGHEKLPIGQLAVARAENVGEVARDRIEDTGCGIPQSRIVAVALAVPCEDFPGRQQVCVHRHDGPGERCRPMADGRRARLGYRD